jgi:hypothetical protein
LGKLKGFIFAAMFQSETNVPIMGTKLVLSQFKIFTATGMSITHPAAG